MYDCKSYPYLCKLTVCSSFTRSKLIDELTGIQRVSVRAIAEGFKGERFVLNMHIYLLNNLSVTD